MDDNNYQNGDAASADASLLDISNNGMNDPQGIKKKMKKKLKKRYLKLKFDIWKAAQEYKEEDKYWKNVHENNMDFSSWTYLIQLIERQVIIIIITITSSSSPSSSLHFFFIRKK